VKFEMWNWKLINNKQVDILLSCILLFSVVCFYMIGSKLGFIGILGFLGGLCSIGAAAYWKWFRLEEKINDAASILLRKWITYFKGFGQINLAGYTRAEKCVAFIEVVERTMKQKELLVSFQNELEGLMKSGFGKTYYRYAIYDNHINFSQPYNIWDMVRPSVLVFFQLVVLSTGAAFTKY